MNLTLLERLMVLSVLPKEGDHATLKVLQNLKMSLAPSEEEIRNWGITSEEGKTFWKENGVADIPIGEIASDIIVKTLRRLDKEKKLPEQAMSVYEKFIPTD